MVLSGPSVMDSGSLQQLPHTVMIRLNLRVMWLSLVPPVSPQEVPLAQLVPGKGRGGDEGGGEGGNISSAFAGKECMERYTNIGSERKQHMLYLWYILVVQYQPEYFSHYGSVMWCLCVIHAGVH